MSTVAAVDRVGSLLVLLCLLHLPAAATAQEVEPSFTSVAREERRFGEERTFEGIEFVRICKGTFTMGSTATDKRAFDYEKPAHRVTLSEFWIGKHEVTNEEYRRFRAGQGGQADLPAAEVTWNQANAFCENFGFRLPTEAEWEYAPPFLSPEICGAPGASRF